MTSVGLNGSSGGIGSRSIGVGGIGIGVDVETGVIGDGGDDGEMALMPLLFLFFSEGENDPIWVLNRGVRIRGEGRVVAKG